MRRIVILLLFSQIFSSCIFKKDRNCNGMSCEQSTISHLAVSKSFVQGSEDIPLLEGMKRDSVNNIGFDSAIGSITSSSYTTDIEISDLRLFYVETLPQMGWKNVRNKKNQLVFARDEEKLEIDFDSEDDKNLVKFLISSSL